MHGISLSFLLPTLISWKKGSHTISGIRVPRPPLFGPVALAAPTGRIGVAPADR